ncbi:MAG TPA: HAD-IC family P-type ATPase [Polyangiaceae bacterium]|nr:HAD-IC family P-type ATPase [Polyangiaceae bacterium]
MNDGVLQSNGEGGVRLRSAVPGRFRLWVPGLYRNDDLGRTLERGLNGSKSGRTVSANVLSATVLVLTPKDAVVDALIEEVEALIERFAGDNALALDELAQRGHSKPKHLMLKPSGPLFTVPRFSLPRLSLPAAPGDETGAKKKKKPKAKHQPGEEQAVHAWHTLDRGQLFQLMQLGTDQGLSDDDAKHRLERYSTNVLTQVEKRSALAMFMGQFKELPVLLLAGSTVLSMLTGGVADGLVILGVIVINGVIGFVTENTAERTIASLTREDAPDVEVVRQGQSLRVPIEEIVPGDVIRLYPGALVPADARLLHVHDLSVDESALTGESVPVGKTTKVIGDPDVPLADRTNMIYRGTLVTGGSGTALVVATGRATQVGQLQQMVGEVERPETPMQKQLRDLGERTMLIAGAVCGGVFLLGLLRGQPMGAMVRTAVSLAVAAVPEGLPTVAITTLALGIRKMKSHHVLVRRLDAIETLGAVQVLCFDKTGTITENRMQVVQASIADEMLQVKDGALIGKDGEVRSSSRRELELMLDVISLCSDTELVDNGAGGLKASGSSTEAALVDCAIAAGLDVTRLRQRHPNVKTEARTETRKLMATFHERPGRPGFLLAVKGSPLEVLDRCSSWLRRGEVLRLTEETRRTIRRQNERMASEALRVLGVAYAEHDSEQPSSDENLTWLGLAGLADPPRPGLPELFDKFRKAGVRSVMITGDQSATAYAVAKQIGLAVDGELRTLDSVELEHMDPDVLAELAPQVQVFSRVSPRHKLRIVQALQKSGMVVAMTGDGINDCPALKAADIGVAMGGSGGTVAREVADVILETDDLRGMLTAIEHGRVIHADIRKAVRFILSTNTSEILLTLLSVAAGFGEGMSPMQLLWINLISDIFPELALAVQPPEDDVLLQPPRDPEAKMFAKHELRQIGVEGGLLTAGAMSVYAYGIGRYGLSPQAQTVSFVTLATAQLLHAFSTRSEKHNIFDANPSAKNKYIPMAVGGGIALTVLMQVIPAARRVFGSTLMPPIDWAVAALGAVGPLLANEMVKAARVSRAQLPAATELPALAAE